MNNHFNIKTSIPTLNRKELDEFSLIPTNLNFQIPISLNPNGVNTHIFETYIILSKIILSLKYLQGLRHWLAKIQELKTQNLIFSISAYFSHKIRNKQRQKFLALNYNLRENFLIIIGEHSDILKLGRVTYRASHIISDYLYTLKTKIRT